MSLVLIGSSATGLSGLAGLFFVGVWGALAFIALPLLAGLVLRAIGHRRPAAIAGAISATLALIGAVAFVSVVDLSEPIEQITLAVDVVVFALGLGLYLTGRRAPPLARPDAGS